MRKLAIVGTHTRTRHLAPFDDFDYEIWTFNEAAMATKEYFPDDPSKAWCKRWDVLFQLHKPEVYTSPNNFVNPHHWEWLQRDHTYKRIYMQAYDPLVPNSVTYPLKDIIESVPGASLRWFKSTGAYALALALYLGYQDISVYGFDLSSNTEYGYQLPNFQYWIGVCLGAGVRFGVISNEEHFTSSLYGYEGETQIDRAHFTARAAELEAAAKTARWEVEKIVNRVDEAFRDDRPDKVAELMNPHRDAVIAAGEADGARDDAVRYAARTDPIPRQEFERRSAQAQRDGQQCREDMWLATGETRYVWNVWKMTKNPQAKAQVQKFMASQMEHAYNAGVRSGVYRENMDYMTKLDDLITAAGGQRTVAALGGV